MRDVEGARRSARWAPGSTTAACVCVCNRHVTAGAEQVRWRMLFHCCVAHPSVMMRKAALLRYPPLMIALLGDHADSSVLYVKVRPERRNVTVSNR